MATRIGAGAGPCDLICAENRQIAKVSPSATRAAPASAPMRRKLADEIIEAQRREIAKMKYLAAEPQARD